jgi:hypothetical protein
LVWFLSIAPLNGPLHAVMHVAYSRELLEHPKEFYALELKLKL